MVFPVRIIMSPTCSSRFLVGKKTRSAAARTTPRTPPLRKPMACIGGAPEGTVTWRVSGALVAISGYVPPAVRAWRMLRRRSSACSHWRAAGEASDRTRTRPSGDFPVEVVKASFPEKQKLAKSSDLVVTVRNAGHETIPNIGVTVNGFDERKQDPDLADPDRPVFAINGVQVKIAGFPESKDAAPRGCDTAYVNTWACGPLQPNEVKTFKLERDGGPGGRLQDRLARERRPRRQGEGGRARRRPGAARRVRRARSRTRRRRCAWPTTATRSSTGLAEPASRSRGSAPPVSAGTSGSGRRSCAAGTSRTRSRGRSGRSSGARRCRTGPLSREVRLALTQVRGRMCESRSICPMCEGRPQVDTP